VPIPTKPQEVNILNMATRVDFYIISDSNPQSEDVVACRLAEKALKQGYKILILGQNTKHLHELDEKLWTFKDDSFIPHEIVNMDSSIHAQLHVALSTDSNAYEKSNLLINLSGQIPNNLSHFERIAEIVPAKQQERHQSRARFKIYRDKQCELQTHNL